MVAMTYNDQFEGLLRLKIAEEVERLKEHLAAGGAVREISDYKMAVGRIAGLRSVLTLADEVRTELAKR